jgi:ActR/RegA family two-component response regulator
MERLVCLGDGQAIQAVGASMRDAGFATKTAKADVQCRLLIEEFRPDLVVLNVGGVADLNVLRGVRRLCASTAIVAIGAATVPLVVEAMRLGASDFLDADQPTQALVEALRRVADRKQRDAAESVGSAEFEPHAARRIAEAVVRVQSSPRDPRTIQQWGRFIGVSAGGLRNWCRTARVLPRRVLLFARILRAVALQDVLHDAPENLLDIVDRRTLTRLLAVSGGTKTSLPENLEEFLRRQELIHDRHLVEEVQRLLATRRLASRPTTRPSAQSGMAVAGGWRSGRS